MVFDLNFIKNIGYVYYITPFLKSPSLVKNRFGLVFSIMFRSSYVMKLTNGSSIKFHKSEFDVLRSFLGTISIATDYSIIENNKVEVSFDKKTKFVVPFKNMSYEDRNFLELLFFATIHGVNFVKDDEINFEDYRDKTMKIIETQGKKIIETSDGVKFFVDSIHVLNTIVECYVNKIHLIHSHDNWENKIVVDAGAECGDTPLYYANLGATVYAFEPIKENFDAFKRNMSLNPEISKKIIPINAAIGLDGKVTFYQNPINPSLGSSFVFNSYGENALRTEVISHSIKSVMEKFDLEKIDLLKLDCKGCEKYLDEEILQKIDKVKIEYDAVFRGAYKLEDLLSLLEKAGFEYMIYRIDPFGWVSNNLSGHIYARKLKK